MNKVEFTDDEFIKICNESLSMRDASKKLNLPFSSFKRRAIKLNCYNTNQAGKGTIKMKFNRVPLKEIFNGRNYLNTASLRNRLIREGYKEEKCECCGLIEWLGKKIPLQLHHKDGNELNNSLENLQILCPNCHAQTDNWCSKNRKRSVAELVDAPDLESGS